MLFKLLTEISFVRTIECDTEEEARAKAQQEEDEANHHNHHGETTRVRVLSTEENT